MFFQHIFLLLNLLYYKNQLIIKKCYHKGPNSSLSKESVIGILQANTNGVAGKDIVNKLNNNEVSRLDTKKQVNKVVCFKLVTS